MCADADKPIVLFPGKPELVPAKPLWGFSTIEAPDPSAGLIVLADEHRALAHSDPAAALDLAADPSVITSARAATNRRSTDSFSASA